MKNYKTKFKQTEPHFAEATRDKLGEIPEDWEVLKLGDVCFPVSDTYNLSDKEEIVFLNTGDILDGKVLNHEKISTEGLPGQAKKRISKGDILFSEIRPANKRYAYIDFDATEHVVSTKLMVIKTKGNINAKYFLTYISSPEILKHFQIIAESRSGTFPQITFDAIKSTPILMPPLPEQQKIAEVLGALDEKIELNRKMNKTLESLAQAVFKKWFIDDANPNWETKKLMEVANIRKGLSYKGKDLVGASEKALAGIKCFKRGGGFNPEGLKPFIGDYKTEHLLNTGDLVVAMTDLTQAGEVLGKPALVPSIKEANKIIASLDIVALDPIAEISKEFLYLLLLRQESQDYLWGYSNGSTVLHLSIIGLREFPVLVPDKDTLAKFDLIAKPIFQSIQNNENQIINLTQIRDSLLPRLMSGKLRII